MTAARLAGDQAYASGEKERPGGSSQRGVGAVGDARVDTGDWRRREEAGGYCRRISKERRKESRESLGGADQLKRWSSSGVESSHDERRESSCREKTGKGDRGEGR